MVELVVEGLLSMGLPRLVFMCSRKSSSAKMLKAAIVTKASKVPIADRNCCKVLQTGLFLSTVTTDHTVISATVVTNFTTV